MRIAALIGRSIGRPVHISSVSLRLLPSPAIEMPGFVVDEEPAVGLRPFSMPTTSSPICGSLPSGEASSRSRASISTTRASIWLRAPNSAWNFASILVQAASSPSAPTGQRRPGIAPRFPSLKPKTRASILREHREKAFRFMKCRVSVWLDSPDQWGIHFRAQPVRTDLDLDLPTADPAHRWHSSPRRQLERYAARSHGQMVRSPARAA